MNLNRFEVINHLGRPFSGFDEGRTVIVSHVGSLHKDVGIDIYIQDNNRTLKVVLYNKGERHESVDENLCSPPVLRKR